MIMRKGRLEGEWKLERGCDGGHTRRGGREYGDEAFENSRQKGVVLHLSFVVTLFPRAFICISLVVKEDKRGR